MLLIKKTSFLTVLVQEWGLFFEFLWKCIIGCVGRKLAPNVKKLNKRYSVDGSCKDG
jgi:hypothetical protein